MFQRARLSSSESFHHVCRPLRAGEAIPPLPGLMQQIASYHADLARLAQLDAAAAGANEEDDSDLDFDD